MDGCTSAAHILNMKLTLMLRLQCLFTYSTPTHISHLAFSAALQRKNSHLCVIISPYPLKKDAPRILEEASSRCRPASRLRSTKREETNFHLTPPSPPYLLGWGEVQPTASVKSYKWFPGPKCHLLQTRRYKDAEALWYESALNSSHLPSDHHLRSNAGWGRHTLNVRYTDAQQIICVWRFSAFLCVWFFFFFLVCFFMSFVPRQSAEHLFGRNNNIWLQWFHNGRERERQREPGSELGLTPGGKQFSSPSNTRCAIKSNSN